MANVSPEVVLGMPFDVGAQKIDGTTRDTYGMVVAAFSVTDKANRVRFFEETFLVANVSPEVVLGMPFLTLSGADVDFLGRELRWRTYTTQEALPTTRRVELVGKKEFAAAALDPEYEAFVVHVASLSSTPLYAAETRASRQEDGGRSPEDRWITPGDPVFRSRASWERFDFPEDLLLADASMVCHLWQYRHTVCV